MTMATSRESYLQVNVTIPRKYKKRSCGHYLCVVAKHPDIFTTPPCKFRRVRLNLFGTAATFYSVCKRLDVNFLIDGRS